MRFSISKAIKSAINIMLLSNMLMALFVLRMYAQDTYPQFRDVPEHRFLVSKNTYYVNPKRTLRYYAGLFKKQNQINHFCIVGYHFSEDKRFNSPEIEEAYGFWQEENQLFLYQAMGDGTGAPADDSWKYAIHTSWDWNHDTRDDDTNLGIHAVTKAWWTSVVRDCWKHGEFYTIQPLAKSKPKPARP